MTSRGEVEAYADGKGPEPAQAGPSPVVSATLPSGGQQGWTLPMPVRQMGLTDVRRLPDLGGGVQRRRCRPRPPAHLRHLLPDRRVRAEDQDRLGLAAHRPAAPRGRRDVPRRPPRTLARLRRTALQPRRRTPNGRRHRSAGSSTPASSTTRTRCRTPRATRSRTTRPRSQSVAALNWLTSLHHAVAGDRLYATPYADPDVMALAGRRMSKDVKTAAQQGTRALAGARLGGATTVTRCPRTASPTRRLSPPSSPAAPVRSC